MVSTQVSKRAADRAKLADRLGSTTVMICGASLILLTITIGGFLLWKGLDTFTVFGHSVWEFLFSSDWSPVSNLDSTTSGSVGAAIFIAGSLITCLLGLLIAVPFSIGAAVFITEIRPDVGERLFRPAVELFLGIPSVVYGWIGLTILVPFINKLFKAPALGFSVLAAGIVLAVMIFPTITTVSADAIRAVNDDYRMGAYGLGSTRWQVIYRVVLPAARTGILTGIILGLARAFGEALAVAMVLGKMQSFPRSILDSTSSLTTKISSEMAEASPGSEMEAGLWTMGLLLFFISIFFIMLIHMISWKRTKSE